jgi:hypothetical protein
MEMEMAIILQKLSLAFLRAAKTSTESLFPVNFRMAAVCVRRKGLISFSSCTQPGPHISLCGSLEVRN